MYQAYIEKVSLNDLYNAALVRAGQHLVQIELQDELPFDQFKTLFKNQIFPLYAKYVYKSDKKTINVQYGVPYIFPDPAPDVVSTVIPVSIYGLYIGEFLNFRFFTHSSFLSTKPLTRFTIAFDYRKPKLHVGYQGMVEVRIHWKVQYNEESGQVEVDPETKDILVDLVAGYIMSAVGRSRRMVRITDSNMEFDATELVTEGEELIREARERLVNLADLTVVNF